MIKVIEYIFGEISFNINLIWVSVVMTPIYFILASLLAHGIENSYNYSKSGKLFLGDISYLMPLSVLIILNLIE